MTHRLHRLRYFCDPWYRRRHDKAVVAYVNCVVAEIYLPLIREQLHAPNPILERIKKDPS
jgi:hypothetical protein